MGNLGWSWLRQYYASHHHHMPRVHKMISDAMLNATCYGAICFAQCWLRVGCKLICS